MLEVPGAGSHRKCGSTSPPLARARRAAGSDGRQGGTRTCSSSCRRCLRLRRQFLIKTYTSQRLRRYHRHGHNARSGARSISIAERATFGTRSRTRSRDVGLVDGVGRKALPAQPNRHIKEVSKLSAHSQPHCPPPGGMGAQRGRTQDPVMPVPSSLPQSPSSFSPLEDGDHREEHGGCPFGTFFAFLFFFCVLSQAGGATEAATAQGGGCIASAAGTAPLLLISQQTLTPAIMDAKGRGEKHCRKRRTRDRIACSPLSNPAGENAYLLHALPARPLSPKHRFSRHSRGGSPRDNERPKPGFILPWPAEPEEGRDGERRCR
jgi:hypothetical protein